MMSQMMHRRGQRRIDVAVVLYRRVRNWREKEQRIFSGEAVSAGHNQLYGTDRRPHEGDDPKMVLGNNSRFFIPPALVENRENDICIDFMSLKCGPCKRWEIAWLAADDEL
jgi:hypothetical protein